MSRQTHDINPIRRPTLPLVRNTLRIQPKLQQRMLARPLARRHQPNRDLARHLQIRHDLALAPLALGDDEARRHGDAGHAAKVGEPDVLHALEGRVAVADAVGELGRVADGPAGAARGGRDDDHARVRLPEPGEVLHQDAAELLGEHEVGCRGCAAEGEEDAVSGGEALGVALWEEGGGVGEDGECVGHLAFFDVWHINGNHLVVLLPHQKINHVPTDLLHPRRSLVEPSLRNPNHLGLRSVNAERTRPQRRRVKVRRRVRVTEDLVQGREGPDIGGNGPVDAVGVAVVLTREAREAAVRRLEAVDGAEGRGDADAAAAVAAQGDGHQAGRDGVG